MQSRRNGIYCPPSEATAGPTRAGPIGLARKALWGVAARGAPPLLGLAWPFVGAPCNSGVRKMEWWGTFHPLFTTDPDEQPLTAGALS